MKSIRTDPRNHAAQGDERIRTAEQWLGADCVYDAHCGLNADVAQNTATECAKNRLGWTGPASRSGDNRERGPAQQRDSGLGRGGSEPPSALSRAEASAC